MLKGKWPSEFGFDIGTHVKVECDDGRLIITKEEARDEILHPAKAPAKATMISVKIPVEAEEKYFSGLKAKDRTDLVMHAMEAWFAGKEAAYVQQ